MAQRKINARDIVVQVESITPGTWLSIAGLRTIEPNPSDGEQAVDTSDVDSDGMEETQIMQRGAAMTLSGFQMQDPTSGVVDPGQDRCKVLADGVGEASLGKFRFRTPASTSWTVWNEATFSLGSQGGDHNAKSAFAVTVKRSGASTTVAV